jgi:hypothetical protein
MVATAVLLLDHVPPPGVLVIVTISLAHKLETPMIGVGVGLTVTERSTEQPVGNA